MQNWEIIHHFDVWGDAESGFEVNDSRSAGLVQLPENASDTEILQALAGKFRLKNCVVSGCDTIEIDAPCGMPVLTLHLAND